MFRAWYRILVNRPSRPSPRSRRPKTCLRLETLEDRCLLSGTVIITSLQGPSTTSATVPAATEGNLASPSFNATFTDTAAVAPANLTVTVNYGDGTTPSTNQGAGADPNLVITQVGGAGGTTYTIADSHTFPEESGSTVPPFTFPLTLTVTENASAANTDTKTTSAQVLDAPLSVGDPVSAGTPVSFTGGNTGNATSAGQALANFETAVGGVKNTVAAPQNGGFRTITWDGVKTDGTDAVAGPNSTVVIGPGHTVAIPLNRFEGSGVFFGAVYAVSNDGFADVNPSVAGLLPAFSPNNTFAMFNDNGIDFKFVAPASPFTPPVSSASRGFGAVFENVQQPGTTITFFNNNTVLETLNVPTNATPGSQVFAGDLFSSPIVTNVLLTLGQGVIFKFDGTTVTSGAANSATNNLVSVDDWAFAEPVPIANGFPIVSGAQGTGNAKVSLTGTVGTPLSNVVVATFSDQDPQANAKDYTAEINWGDGHFSNGVIAADGRGGFTVSGSNTYAHAGLFPVNVDIADFGGGPGVAGSNPTLSVNNTVQVLAGSSSTTLAINAGSALFGQPVILTATVTGAGGATPTGTVTFFNNGQVLGTAGVNASGQAVLTTASLAPGEQDVIAVYNGDANVTGSASAPAGVLINPDVTSLVTVNVGRPKRLGRKFRVTVTLKNHSGSFIPAPIDLVLDKLTAGVQLSGAFGTTHVLPPLGDPFVTLNLAGASVLAPGGSLTVKLDFTGRNARRVQFTPRILAGISQV
jgi:hypothetical protein